MTACLYRAVSCRCPLLLLALPATAAVAVATAPSTTTPLPIYPLTSTPSTHTYPPAPLAFRSLPPLFPFRHHRHRRIPLLFFALVQRMDGTGEGTVKAHCDDAYDFRKLLFSAGPLFYVSFGPGVCCMSLFSLQCFSSVVSRNKSAAYLSSPLSVCASARIRDNTKRLL